MKNYHLIIIIVILTTLVVIIDTRKVRYDPQVSSTSTRILIETPKQEVEMEVTAYSEYDSCHYEDCVMASGKPAYVGAIACPRGVKIGSEAHLDGFGWF